MATAKDVAKRANVSTATVSRVINGQSNATPDIRARVLEAIQALNYRPSRVARRLRTNSTYVIGLIISDIQNFFYTSLTRGVEDVALQHGYSVILCNTEEDPRRERQYLEVMYEENVAGIILASATAGDYDPPLLNGHIPVVALDRLLSTRQLDTVLADNVAGAKIAVAHLLALGHRRVGAIIGDQRITSSLERQDGYEQALADFGLPVEAELIRKVDLRHMDDSRRQTHELLALPDRPTALFTGNALITLGTLTAIHEAGLRIPEDVALVSFDDVPWGQLLNPPLTAVSQPTYQLGKTAAELLVARIANPTGPTTLVRLPLTLIVRESCGARRPKAATPKRTRASAKPAAAPTMKVVNRPTKAQAFDGHRAKVKK
jgi:LacI family transcriptional regulator